METRPIIALIGRPNVGKSTLFNRLIGRREAIVSHIPGTTRDRHFGVMHWFNHSWTVIDTAGVLLGDDEDAEMSQKELQDAMEDQVATAVDEATLIGLVVDVKEGLHPIDAKLMDLLRRENKPVVILVNKSDNAAFRTQAETFASYGFDTVFPISAIHGSGIGDFVDYLTEHFPSPSNKVKEDLPRVTFIGRPNVGKSTLVNRILGTDRMIVSETPGTTRDTISEKVTLEDGTEFTLVDTAGIRRRGKIEAGIEKFSLFRTLRAINHSDIVVMLLTLEEAPTRGDAHVAMYAMEARKNIILVINKGDLAVTQIFRLSPKEKERLADKFLKRFPFMQKMPTYFTSGQTGQGVKELTSAIKEAISAQVPTVAPSPEHTADEK